MFNPLPLPILLLLASKSFCITYSPVFRNDSVIEIIHGTPIPDPYRWLENLSSEETKNFIKDQVVLSESFLSSHPNRSNIKSHLANLVNYSRWGAPRRRGPFLSYLHNPGLQEYDVVMVVRNDEETILLDPNSLSDDGTISLSPYYQTYSRDGSLWVYALVIKGSDWIEGRVTRMEDGVELSDRLRHIKWPDFSFSKGGDGIFYSRFPLDDNGEPMSHPEIHYHRLGTDQDSDFFVMTDSDHPEWWLFAEVTHDGEAILLKPQPDFKSNSVLLGSLVYFNELKTKESLPTNFVEVFSALEHNARFIYVTNIGTRFIFLSDHQAPNFRLLEINVDLQAPTPTVGNPTVLVEEHPTRNLKWVEIINNQYLLLCYMVNVQHIVQLHHITNGSLFQTVTLPIEGVISDHSTTADRPEFFLRQENLVHPGIIFHCVIVDTSVNCEVWREMKLSGLNMSNYVMEQLFVTSKDSTKIPLFVAHPTNLEKDGESPALLFGYGGFNVDVLPSFNPLTFGFISYFGGTYASANIRGGAEYGEPWHASGTRLLKQNSFDDFISCASWLQNQSYTSPSKLAIQGSSNGGMLVGAVANQRPDLFGVTFPDVGLMDMLRFHLSSIGSSWYSEYGNPEEEPHFRNLHSYSPLHNVKVKEGQRFPATLATTAENDDRVLPFHSYKYVATLQHVHGGVEDGKPLLLKVTPNAGHSEGKPLSVQIEDYTDYYAFYEMIVGDKRSSGGGVVQGVSFFVYFTILLCLQWVW